MHFLADLMSVLKILLYVNNMCAIIEDTAIKKRQNTVGVILVMHCCILYLKITVKVC